MRFNSTDKLCLDDQRLIVTDAAGLPVAGQAGYGLSGSEYRTEKDAFTRVRAYGGSSSNGPDYFRAWTKSGLIYEYGATSDSRILVHGRSVVMAWALNRVTDTAGNFMSLSYYSWSNSFSGSAGREWGLQQIRYAGNGAQAPANKVEFAYQARPDQAETFHQGAKSVSTQRLSAIRTWTGTQADGSGGIKVSTLKLTYSSGGVTGRSRLAAVQVCGGAAEAVCMPKTEFTYSSGAGLSYQSTAHSSLTGVVLKQSDGQRGVLQGDFNGDGRQDLFRWSTNASENELMLSNGDGSFAVPSSTGLKSAVFGHPKGCYRSYIADFNADGISDILRTSTPDADPACAGVAHSASIYTGSTIGSFSTPYALNIPLAKSPPNYQTVCVAWGNSEGECTQWQTNISHAGKNFHIADLNADGIPDVLTTSTPPGTIANPPSACAESTCIFLGSATSIGTFSKISTNLAAESLYFPIEAGATIYRGGYTGDPIYVDDLNGDGLPDILLRNQAARFTASGAVGNYVKTTGNVPVCGIGADILDGNGDGKWDVACLDYGELTNVPYKLWLNDGTGSFFEKGGVAGLTGGVPTTCQSGDTPEACPPDYPRIYRNFVSYVAADFDGDGVSDILALGRSRYAVESTSMNGFIKGNRNGTYTIVSSMFDWVPLAWNSEHDVLVGDFTGTGSVDILRISNNPASNVLFFHAAPLPADTLVNVHSGTGATTTINYKPLTDPTVYSRLVGASYPVVDLVTAQWVVSSVNQPNGRGSQIQTAYKYTGQRAHLGGRGYMGFRTVEKTSYGPNGTPLKTKTTNLQDFPFTGLPQETRRSVSNQGDSAWTLLSTSSYADLHNLNCPVSVAAGTPRLYRPVLLTTIEQTRDLNLTPMAKVTTTNSNYTCFGDPQQIEFKTEGEIKGTPVTYNKVTVHQYQPPNTAGDGWIVGRLLRTDVTNTVPDVILASNTGSAPLTFNGLTLGVTPANPTASRSTPGAVTTTVTATAAGGYPGYTYSWARVSGSLFSVTNTGTGTFTISGSLTWNQSVTEHFRFDVVDTSGAKRSVEVPVTFSVGPPPPLVVSQPPNAANNPLSGPGVSTASTTFSVSGGTGAYQYTWQRISGARTSVMYPNSRNQTFTANLGWSENFTERWRVTVNDGISPSVARELNVTFRSVAPMSISVSPNPAVINTGECYGWGYSVTVYASASGGSGSYSYTWTPQSPYLTITPNGSSASITSSANNQALYYTVTATDSGGRTASIQSYFAKSTYCSDGS